MGGMAQSVASSSSGSSSGGSRGKRGRKEKDKNNKKEKKANNDKMRKKSKTAEKLRRAKERAACWECDRGEAVRLLRSLLQLDAEVAEELGVIFEALDSNAVVRLDSLENKQARKKLRHLMQALQLQPAEGGFKTPNRKVCFQVLFEALLLEAKRGSALGLSAAAAPSGGGDGGSWAPVDVRPQAMILPGPTAGMDANAATRDELGSKEEKDAPAVLAAESAEPPQKPRTRGPQLPTASVGRVGGDESDAEGQSQDGEGAGPKFESAERQGVDLDLMDERESRREAWMTICPDSMLGTFGSGESCSSRSDRFEVSRSAAEQKEFENMFKARGPSLLQAQAEGQFAGYEEEREQARKRPRSGPDLWGVSEKEQERAAMSKQTSAPRRPFDPDQDMKRKTPITAEAFTKLVNNSQSNLSGHFARGAMTTSFL